MLYFVMVIKELRGYTQKTLYCEWQGIKNRMKFFNVFLIKT